MNVEAMLMQHRSWMIRFVCRIGTLTSTEAEDVVQDSCIKAIRNQHLYRGPRFQPWIARIMVRTIIDEVRRRDCRPRCLSLDALVEDFENEPLALGVIDPAFGLVELRTSLADLAQHIPGGWVLMEESQDTKAMAVKAGVTHQTMRSRVYRVREIARAVYESGEAA